MKKLSFLLIVFIPLFVFSQEGINQPDLNKNKDANYDPIYDEPSENVKQFSYKEIFMDASVNKSETEIQFMRYCNFRYHKQRRTAYLLAGTGIVATAGGLLLPIEDPGFPVLLATAGGALNIAGLIVLVSADKWLKYSAVKPSDTGLGVKITF